MRKILTVFIIIFSFYLLFCDESTEKFGLIVEAVQPEPERVLNIDKTINLSAQPVENPGKECIPLIESYQKHVFEARYAIDNDKEKQAVNHYLKHLKCWNDKDVYDELAEHYKRQGKLYLAGLTYKKAGMMNEYNEVKKLKESIGENDFQILARKEHKLFNDKYNSKKIGATILFVLGPIAALTGLGLLVSSSLDTANYPKILPYGLIIGGFSIAGAGILIDQSANNSYNTGISYLQISENYSGDHGTLPSEYYKYSGFDNETLKMSAESYQTHGGALIGLSVPLLAIAIYGFFDSAKSMDSDDDDSSDSGFISNGAVMSITHILQIFTLAPGIASLTGGIIMLVKASKYEKLSTEPSLLTLNSITPVINPVSKTYGLALGFSF